MNCEVSESDGYYCITSNCKEETIEAGTRLARSLPKDKPVFVALFGDMGVGKTVFTGGFCRELGVNGPVLSPTFALMNEYCANDERNVFHFDFFRTQSADKLFESGFFDLLERVDAVLICEWSENVEEFIPKDAVRVRILKISEEQREIHISGGMN